MHWHMPAIEKVIQVDKIYGLYVVQMQCLLVLHSWTFFAGIFESQRKRNGEGAHSSY
jgi:hypothetical protein